MFSPKEIFDHNYGTLRYVLRQNKSRHPVARRMSYIMISCLSKYKDEYAPAIKTLIAKKEGELNLLKQLLRIPK